MAVNILIRTPNHLGDSVMALPMVNEAREAHPGATVTILAPESLVDVFSGSPAIDTIIPIPTQYVHGLVAVMKIKELISSQGFDIGYVLPPSFGAAAGFKLAGIPERVGYIADGRRLLLTRPLPLPTPLNSEHRSEIYFNLLRRASGTELSYVHPKLFLNEEDTAKGMEVLESFGVADSDEYAVVACRAVAESRRWGSDNYSALVRYLVDRRGLKVVLTGSGDDREASTAIETALDNPGVLNLAGKTSLRESAAVFSGAALFVGNDSGPAHLAAAVGCPLVVLSGADDPKETSPMSARKRLVYLENLECISCVKNKCPLKGDQNMACMRGISLPMVVSAIEELIS